MQFGEDLRASPTRRSNEEHLIEPSFVLAIAGQHRGGDHWIRSVGGRLLTSAEVLSSTVADRAFANARVLGEGFGDLRPRQGRRRGPVCGEDLLDARERSCGSNLIDYSTDIERDLKRCAELGIRHRSQHSRSTPPVNGETIRSTARVNCKAMTDADSPRLAGLVLAAGAGTRSGSPKALRRTPAGEPWLARSVRRLADAPCDPVLVVLGASAEAALALLPHEVGGVQVVVNRTWSDGLHSSLRVGLGAVARTTADALLVTLVDLPEMPDEVIHRIIGAGPISTDTLRRAVFAGEPGHPTLIGRSHWGAIAATLDIDRGAGAYLSAHGVMPVECGDLWDGQDVDYDPASAR